MTKEERPRTTTTIGSMAAVAHTVTQGRFSGLTYQRSTRSAHGGSGFPSKITGNISCKITGMPKPLETAATMPPITAHTSVPL
ncbi:unknown [Akkermansia sp. CAG:344]|nr:unknown [Akkermansia sp. CAG:344]